MSWAPLPPSDSWLASMATNRRRARLCSTHGSSSADPAVHTGGSHRCSTAPLARSPARLTSDRLAESAQYLRHDLALVGRTDPLVANDAIARLHKAGLGLPLALNNA